MCIFGRTQREVGGEAGIMDRVALVRTSGKHVERSEPWGGEGVSVWTGQCWVGQV